MISETRCLVNIYGLGISGRVITNSGKTSKSIIIEAYSVWNSTNYLLQLTMPRLKSLFLNNAEFLLAGNKSKLLTELLKFLYFDYEIHFPPFPHETDKGVEIIRLSHLETAEFPEGYPQCVIDVLKIVSDERSTNVTPLPTIIQTLNISNVELENGAEKRKREAEQRRRRELEEEERKRLAWLAIPKRLRGMVFARAMRAAGKLVSTALL